MFDIDEYSFETVTYGKFMLWSRNVCCDPEIPQIHLWTLRTVVLNNKRVNVNIFCLHVNIFFTEYNFVTNIIPNTNVMMTGNQYN